MSEQEQPVGDDWIDYLEETDRYASYDGFCDCYSCRLAREDYFKWKQKKRDTPTPS